jgi:hypothetical protein
MRAPRHKVGVVRRTGLGRVGFRYRTAQHDTRLEVNAREHLVEDGAADIIEKDIDPIGAKFRKPSADVFILVVRARRVRLAGLRGDRWQKLRRDAEGDLADLRYPDIRRQAVKTE